MSYKDVVDGLTSHNQRINDVIDPKQFFFGCSDAGTGFLPLGKIIRVSFGRCVVSVLFLAEFLLRTSGTHIGRLIQQLAVTGNIPITQLSAVSLGAELAACKATVSRVLWTNCVFQTREKVDAVIVRVVVELAREDTMLMYLSGDS